MSAPILPIFSSFFAFWGTFLFAQLKKKRFWKLMLDQNDYFVVYLHRCAPGVNRWAKEQILLYHSKGGGVVVGKGWKTKGWGNVSLLQFSEWIIFTLERSWLNFIFIPVQNLENRTLHSKVIRKNDLQKLAENLPNTPFEADNYNKGILNNIQLNMRICSMDHQHDQNHFINQQFMTAIGKLLKNSNTLVRIMFKIGRKVR